MAIAGIIQDGNDVLTGLKCLGAARVKDTTRGGIQWAGRFTWK